ncbi:hypothetical protein [Streptomyces sp. NPDC048663]
MDTCRRAPFAVPSLARLPHTTAHGPEDEDDPFVPGRTAAR